MYRVRGAVLGALLAGCLGATGSASVASARSTVPLVRASGAARVAFEDATKFAGVGTRSYAGGGLASGSAWGDFNGDGRPDLFVGNHYDTPVLFKNLGGGKFAKVTTDVMVRPDGIVGAKWGDQHGAAWADVNGDGNEDLLVLVGAQEGQGRGLNQLYINTRGHLVDRAVQLNIDYPMARARTPQWFDFNNDGRLDLFMGAVKRPDGLAPPTIFQRTGATFTDVRNQVHFLPTNSVSGWVSDLNRDGRLELLYQGQGRLAAPAAPFGTRLNVIDTTHSTFRDATPRSFRGTFSDLAVADYDGNLRPDLFFCNSWRSGRKPYGNDLYLNRPSGFTRVTGAQLANINQFNRPCRPSAIAADFDNDMDVDIYLDNGSGSSLHGDGGDIANVMLWNRGDGTFDADGNAGGAIGRLSGWADSASAADYDGDGFVDIYLTYDRELSQLYRNRGNGNHWLELSLRGTRSNTDGIGAQVYVTAGGITQLREQNGGTHRYWSQNDQTVHFGLGANRTASEVVVKWPSGQVQRLTSVSGDRKIVVTEP